MRILIIEDEQDIRDLLKKGLESECYAVDTAEDGERGVYLASLNRYDLIIMDNVMPKKHGIEVCRELREKGVTAPIIVLSVKNESATKVDLLNAGADDYMTKPFSLEELCARMRALLRRPAVLEHDIIQVDDLTLDTVRHVVKRDGVEIRLTKKEFMFLEYLMRNHGTVLSRGMIMEHVWDMNADPFSNTIESHVRSLRKKIDELPGDEHRRKLIHTVSGRGYKIES